MAIVKNNIRINESSIKKNQERDEKQIIVCSQMMKYLTLVVRLLKIFQKMPRRVRHHKNHHNPSREEAIGKKLDIKLIDIWSNKRET